MALCPSVSERQAINGTSFSVAFVRDIPNGWDGTMEHWNEGKGSAVYFTLGQPWMR